MANFVPALNFVLDSEDSQRSYAIGKDSNGYAVCAGINAKFYPEVIEQLSGMPQANRGPAVATFFHNLYWAPNFTRLQSQKVCSKLLDMAVNMGLHEAVMLAQRAINAFHLPNIAVDGVFGSDTVAALNSAPELVMLQAMGAKAKEFYLALAVEKPEQYAESLNGWLKRAARMPQ